MVGYKMFFSFSDHKMGNTVSAAEMAATQIISPAIAEPAKPKFDHSKLDHKAYTQGEIPPECPMHKKGASASPAPVNTGSSECPVGGDVNPLNMVSIKLFSILYRLITIFVKC